MPTSLMTMPTLDLGSVRGVLFDMDGVIVDSEPTSARIMQRAALEFGFEVPDEAMGSFKGLPGDVVYERVASDFGGRAVSGPDLRATRDRLYEDVLADIPLMPSIRLVLDRIRSLGWRMALVTSSRRRHAEVVVETHALRPYFGAILGSEDVSRPKPAPDPFVQAAAGLGLEPAACLAIEDSLNGVRSASAAGCIVVGFGTDFSRDVLEAAGSAIVVKDHEGLERVITGQSRSASTTVGSRG